MAGSDTRNERATSPVERPPSERRVAAGEEQSQPVVRDGGHVVAIGFHAGGCERLELAQLLLVAPLAAQPIDRLVARRTNDPGGGVVGQPVARPALERRGERLLHRVLGEVEIAQDPDQRGDRPPRLPPEQAVDN
jgi:hypothetical protein